VLPTKKKTHAFFRLFGYVITRSCIESAVEEIIWNFDNVQKAYATRGYEAKKLVGTKLIKKRESAVE
jgi:hypothetical protein